MANTTQHKHCCIRHWDKASGAGCSVGVNSKSKFAILTAVNTGEGIVKGIGLLKRREEKRREWVREGEAEATQ